MLPSLEPAGVVEVAMGGVTARIKYRCLLTVFQLALLDWFMMADAADAVLTHGR